MGKVKFSNAVRVQAQELLDQGMSFRAVREELKNAGVDPLPSVGWLSNLAREKEAPVSVGVAPVAPPVAEGEATEEQALRMLQYQADQLMHALASSADVRSIGAIARALNATLAEIRKSRPKEPDDPDAIPGHQIRDAAERGRNRLHELLGRVTQGWPTCESCGRPMPRRGKP